MKHIKTQKIYTFPERKFYGEFCATSLLELRLKIVKREITEQLCFLDENDRAYCFNQFGIPDGFPDFYLEEINTKLLTEILHEQVKIRIELGKEEVRLNKTFTSGK